MPDIDMDPVYEVAGRAYTESPETRAGDWFDASIRAAVDAARPLIEAAVREQVAQAIEAEHERIRPRDMRPFDGLVGMASSRTYENAARIARGET